MQKRLLNALLPALAVSLAVTCANPAGAAAEGILGSWARGDGNAHVRISPCGGGFCAVNTWIKDQSSGEHVGDRLVMKVSGNGSSMSGTAYDPQRKLSYNLEINVGSQSMQTRGCVLAGIVCKSISWTRLK